MFSLKRETDYAVQLVCFLSRKNGRPYKSLREFSDRSGISFWFLQKIARKLHLAGVIEAEQGVNGGYKLKLPVKSLNLYKIFEIMEGRQATTPCLGEAGSSCALSGKSCCFRSASAKLNKEIVIALKKIKIASLK